MNQHLKDIQNSLFQLGYNDETNIDGLYGEKTEKSLNNAISNEFKPVQELEYIDLFVEDSEAQDNIYPNFNKKELVGPINWDKHGFRHIYVLKFLIDDLQAARTELNQPIPVNAVARTVAINEKENGYYDSTTNTYSLHCYGWAYDLGVSGEVKDFLINYFKSRGYYVKSDYSWGIHVDAGPIMKEKGIYACNLEPILV